jgi:hypothetical protein
MKEEQELEIELNQDEWGRNCLAQRTGMDYKWRNYRTVPKDRNVGI